MEERERGTIKAWLKARGFGFVRLDSGRDAFLHFSEVAGQPAPGDRIEGEVRPGPRGAFLANAVLITESTGVTEDGSTVVG